MDGFKFDPTKQYGDYLMFEGWHVPESLIEEGMDLLQKQIDAVIPQDLLPLGDLVWIVDPEHLEIDPETRNVYKTTSVAWKWTPHKKGTQHAEPT